MGQAPLMWKHIIVFFSFNFFLLLNLLWYIQSIFGFNYCMHLRSWQTNKQLAPNVFCYRICPPIWERAKETYFEENEKSAHAFGPQQSLTPPRKKSKMVVGKIIIPFCTIFYLWSVLEDCFGPSRGQSLHLTVTKTSIIQVHLDYHEMKSLQENAGDPLNPAHTEFSIQLPISGPWKVGT